MERPLRAAGTAVLWRAIQLAGVKGIFVVRLLVLARLLGPEDFGLVAVAGTATGFLLHVTEFGLVTALIQRADVDEQRYHAVWTVGVIRALIISGSVFLAASTIARLFAEPRAIPIIRALAVRPLLDGLASIKVADLTRNLQFRSLAAARLAEALASAIISVVLAHPLGVWALVVGTLAGSAMFAVMSYILAPYRPKLSVSHTAVRSLFRFGRWILLTSLVVMAGSYMLRVVISRQLGVAELGLYYLATQLAFLPAEIANEVVGSVAFPLFASLQFELGQATRVFRTMLTSMSAMLIPVCAVLIALAPTLTQDVLGPRWAGAGSVIRVLALAGMVGLLGEVTTPLLKGLGQPYKVTVQEAAQSLLIIALAWGLASRFGLTGAAMAWLPAIVVSQVLGVVFTRQVLAQPFARLGLVMLGIVAASGVGAAVALLVDRHVPGVVGFGLAGLLALVAIGAALWISDRRFGLGLLEDLAHAFPQIASLLGHRLRTAG